MSKYVEEKNDDGTPNPIISAVSDAVALLRADADQLDLAKAHEELGPKAIEKLTVAEARQQPTVTDAVKALLAKQGRSSNPTDLVPGVTTWEISVAGAEGQLPATVYTPEGTGPFPLILYIHGGGWVIADRKVYDGGARGLSKEANAVVVSIDYRQAPERRFPAAWDDCIAAYQWLVANTASLNADSGRIAIAGESAGGNLAVATAMAARDKGLPLPVHVVSVYPVAQTGRNTESYLENAIAKPLNRAMMEWFFNNVKRNDEDLDDPRLSLIDANLEGLPPVTIINARLDPLRSDGAQLEDALKKANVPVERKSYEGVAHEFFGAAAVLHKAKEAQAYAGSRLKEAFAGRSR